MRSGVWRLILAPLLVLMILAPAALAQDEVAVGPEEQTLAWGLYAGSIQGAEVTNESVFGLRPELDDSTTIGALLRVEASERWQLEVRLGLSSTTFLEIPDLDDPVANPAREVDATLYYLDVGLVPNWTWGRVTFGVPFGVGWAGTSADTKLSSFLPGRDLDLEFTDGSGPQYFAGVQALIKTGGRWGVVADARVHRFHRVTNVIEQNANMPEFTIGVVREF